jgi:hypothetical protein
MSVQTQRCDNKQDDQSSKGVDYLLRTSNEMGASYCCWICCRRLLFEVCEGSVSCCVGYTVNHYCLRVCQRCASCCCSICCRRLLLEVCWWSVLWCGWVYCQPLLFLSLLAECVVVVLVILYI